MSYEFDYVRIEDGVRITAYHGDALRVEIPAEIGGLPVARSARIRSMRMVCVLKQSGCPVRCG